MPFTISLDQLSKAAQGAQLVPVQGGDPKASARYTAKMVRVKRDVWSTGNEYMEYTFEITAPAYVDSNANEVEEGTEGAIRTQGMEVGEKVTLVENVTSWKLPALFAGYKEYLVANGMVEEVDGEARAAIDPLNPEELFGVPVGIVVQRNMGKPKTITNLETGDEETITPEYRGVARTFRI